MMENRLANGLVIFLLVPNYKRGWGKMERKWNKTVSDKVDFIIHRIIVGIVFWIVSSVVITYQQYIVKHIDNILLFLSASKYTF